MSHTILNLRHLRAFCEVARCQSISGAASQVYLSQPAITQALAKLERVLDIALFDRKNNGMFVTEPGQLFLNRVKRALAYINEGTRAAAKVASKSRSGGFRHFDQLLTSAQLRALLAVSDAGNFSLAARNIGVSQPSLHRMARDLERLSGVLFFDKVPQGIKLTSAAQALAYSARLAFSELRQAGEEIDAWKGLDTGEIMVGTMPLARTFILPTAVKYLLEMRPQTRVKIIDGPYDDLLHGLRHGELDLLVGALRDPLPIDDVEQTALFSDPLAIVARHDHPLAGKKSVSVADLANFPWIVPRQTTPTRGQFEALFNDTASGVPTRLVESSSLIFIRGLLLESDHLTIISGHQVRHEENQHLLRRLNVDLDHTSRAIGITVRKNWQPTKTQSLLLDLLAQASQQIDLD